MSKKVNVEELKSGSYRIRQTVKGVTYRITVDHKPSQKEITMLLAERMGSPITGTAHSTSFEKAYNDYVQSKDNVLSPATLRGYESIKKNIPEWFLKKSVFDIDNLVVQRLINDYSKTRSPKSTRNLHALVVGVMKMARPEFVSTAKLPQKERKQDYIPSDEDIQNILNMAKGSKFEIALKLATYGLRRGEVCALELSDLSDDNMLHIYKDKIQNKNGEWEIKKCPKTDESNRVVYLDDDLANLIREKGVIFEGCPDSIYHYIIKAQDRLGIPRFSLHKLRHYFASATHGMGLSDADIMAMGGWRTDNIMKSVYRHSREKSVSEGRIMFAEKMKALNK